MYLLQTKPIIKYSMYIILLLLCKICVYYKQSPLSNIQYILFYYCYVKYVFITTVTYSYIVCINIIWTSHSPIDWLQKNTRMVIYNRNTWEWSSTIEIHENGHLQKKYTRMVIEIYSEYTKLFNKLVKINWNSLFLSLNTGICIGIIVNHSVILLLQNNLNEQNNMICIAVQPFEPYTWRPL